MAANISHQGKGSWVVMIPTLLSFPHTPIPGFTPVFSESSYLPACV